MDLRHHPMWLLPNGTDVQCPNWEHARESAKVFRSANPEREAMTADWLKIWADGYEIGRPLTHAQRKTLERWGQDADAIEAEALGKFRLHERLGDSTCDAKS